jgi:hypothetical protein
MTVMEFSMLPLQAHLQIETPDGIGPYEGITSSGIVTVFINGGMRQYSWNECFPQIMLHHILMMEDFCNKWKDKYSRKAKEEPALEESQECIFDDMFCKYFDLIYQQKKSTYHACLEIQKQFTITRKP